MHCLCEVLNDCLLFVLFCLLVACCCFRCGSEVNASTAFVWLVPTNKKEEIMSFSSLAFFLVEREQKEKSQPFSHLANLRPTQFSAASCSLTWAFWEEKKQKTKRLKKNSIQREDMGSTYACKERDFLHLGEGWGSKTGAATKGHN